MTSSNEVRSARRVPSRGNRGHDNEVDPTVPPLSRQKSSGHKQRVGEGLFFLCSLYEREAGLGFHVAFSSEVSYLDVQLTIRN